MSPGGIAAVTGASRGIGRSAALRLASQGYRVFALARNEADLDQLVEDATADGALVEPIAVDIANDVSRTAAIDRIMQDTDGYGLDVLVNNAGFGQLGPVEEVSLEQLRYQFEVNVFGVHAFTIPFLPGMRSRKKGRIVNVSSVAGRISTPFMGAYSASKYALEAMSDALRLELSPFGVRVILIEPGPIATSFSDAAERVGLDINSPYGAAVRTLQRSKRASDLFTRSADTVARVIVRAALAERPRARYTITLSAKVGALGRRILPDAILDEILLRATRS